MVMLLLIYTSSYSYAEQLPSIKLSLKEPYAHRLENARAKLYRGKYLCAVDVRLDLACANAGKAHLLAKAEIERWKYPVLLEGYTLDYQKWEQAQKDSGAILFGASAPVKPGSPKTSDDNLVLSNR